MFRPSLSALVFGEWVNGWQLLSYSVAWLVVLICFIGDKKSLITNNFHYLNATNNNISAAIFLMIFVWLNFFAQFSGITAIKYFFCAISVMVALECISNMYSSIEIFKKIPLMFAELSELNNVMCVKINSIENNIVNKNDYLATIEIFEIDTTFVDDGLRYISTSKINGDLIEANKFVFEVENFNAILEQIKKQSRGVFFSKFSRKRFFAIYCKLIIAGKQYEFCWR